MGWEFRLLGPLELRRDGVAVAAGSVKQRMLLASLLLDVNRVVSVNRLIAALWERDPPTSAIANIRTYASQLRLTLTDGNGDSRLAGRPPGYLLTAADDEFDLAVFTQRAAAGRAAMSRGELRQAVSAFREALARWRGPAGEDTCQSGLLATRLAGLDQQRLTVIEELVAARQQLGENAQLIPELRQLTYEHPLREQLWQQLIVSLYRTGDIAGALDAYEQARSALVRDLGVDPGTELSALYQAVLSRDPALLAESRAADGTEIRPRELPSDVARLVGRDREVAMATGALADVPTIAFYGTGGVGKSALAVHVAHQIAPSFPDGQIYVDLGGPGGQPQAPVDVLRRVIRTLGVPADQMPQSEAEASARYRSFVVGRQMIVLLDNATSAEQVRPLLVGGGGTVVMITSRRMLATIDRAVHIEVNRLTEQDAAQLLAAVCGPERIAAEPAETARLAVLCDRSPLALRIAGARLAARPLWSIGELVRQLSDERTRLDTLAFGDLAVRSSVELSFRAVGGDAAALLGLLGLVRIDEFTLNAVAALGDLPSAQAAPAFDQLIEQRLVEQTGPGRFRIGDLVRLFAGDLTVAGRPEALHRLLCFYLCTARRAWELVHPAFRPARDDGFFETVPRLEFADALAATAWLDQERANLLTLARQVADERAAVARFVPLLLSCLHQYLAADDSWDDLDELAQLSRAVAVRDAAWHAEAEAMVCLAAVCRARGTFGQAVSYLERAGELRRRFGDEHGVADCLTALGQTLVRSGDLGTGLARLKDGAALYDRHGLRLAASQALHEAGEVLCRLGRYAEAETSFEQALAVRQAERDLTGEAITLAAMGITDCLRGSDLRAVGRLTDALARCRATSAHRHSWQALMWRAAAYQRLGQSSEMAADLRSAWDLSRSHGDVNRERFATVLLEKLSRGDEGDLKDRMAAEFLF
ncbi:AfsR/SARP family transcriptional regulator [Catellatospora vulcania]|uniref:AfsR/SARP family transcriptional regulator n=1 Tax=Catellatospora vulcania TaxID=1460450 RepID=UPI0012D38516|nr:BTAD domain-containing putative transcriptional regulator [Catellatospora vulcania]